MDVDVDADRRDSEPDPQNEVRSFSADTWKRDEFFDRLGNHATVLVEDRIRDRGDLSGLIAKETRRVDKCFYLRRGKVLHLLGGRRSRKQTVARCEGHIVFGT